MDDVTFGRNGRDAETWKPHYHRGATTTSGVAIPGRSLMSVNALFYTDVYRDIHTGMNREIVDGRK